MNTKINLTYKGVPYVLEYTRMGVKLLEANGFQLEEFLRKPMSNVELVFAGAFLKNHQKSIFFLQRMPQVICFITS